MHPEQLLSPNLGFELGSVPVPSEGNNAEILASPDGQDPVRRPSNAYSRNGTSETEAILPDDDASSYIGVSSVRDASQPCPARLLTSVDER